MKIQRCFVVHVESGQQPLLVGYDRRRSATANPAPALPALQERLLRGEAMSELLTLSYDGTTWRKGKLYVYTRLPEKPIYELRVIHPTKALEFHLRSGDVLPPHLREVVAHPQLAAEDFKPCLRWPEDYENFCDAPPPLSFVVEEGARLVDPRGRVWEVMEVHPARDGLEQCVSLKQENMLSTHFRATSSLTEWRRAHDCAEAARQMRDQMRRRKQAKVATFPMSPAPQHFGAIGDGVNDDTEAVQAALNAAGSLGRKLVAPPLAAVSHSLQDFIVGGFARYKAIGRIHKIGKMLNGEPGYIDVDDDIYPLAEDEDWKRFEPLVQANVESLRPGLEMFRLQANVSEGQNREEKLKVISVCPGEGWLTAEGEGGAGVYLPFRDLDQWLIRRADSLRVEPETETAVCPSCGGSKTITLFTGIVSCKDC